LRGQLRVKVGSAQRSMEGMRAYSRCWRSRTLRDCTPMAPEASQPTPAFGFLTAVEDARHGYFGGYLVLSERGRPLEFHCSTPVLASQAQQILYGATLRPYLLGELIGETLVAKAQLPVQAVLTDLEEMQSLALLRSEAVAWIRPNETASVLPQLPIDVPQVAPDLTLGNYQLSGSTTCYWQADWLRDTLAPLAAHVDLAEPFERIREAIREAQRVTEPSGDNEHESSAAA
jgi:hypothetical protein